MPSSALEPMYVPGHAPVSVAVTVFRCTPTVARSDGATVLTWLLQVSWRRPAKSMAQRACFHVAIPSTAGTSTLFTWLSRLVRWTVLYAHSYSGSIVVP